MISDQNRDYYAGGLVAVIGLGAAIIGSRYQVGTLTQMGPGFVPTALGVLLALIGLVIAFLNSRSQQQNPQTIGGNHHGITGPGKSPDWRAWGCIISGVLLFIVSAEYLGLLPAIFLCVFVSARGDRTASWTSSFLLATGVTIFGIVLFSWLLGVQIPIIQGFS